LLLNVTSCGFQFRNFFVAERSYELLLGPFPNVGRAKGVHRPVISLSKAEETMSANIIQALQTFELDQHHEKIYVDPNELIEAGFPAFFLLPLIKVFESSDGYKYFRDGKIVNEMIGISHLSLIYAIANHVGVPPGTGSNFTGSGFAMQANIDEIRKILERHKKRKVATVSQKPLTQNYSVVLFLKKDQQFDRAAAELMSIANLASEVFDEGDSGVFRFGFETKSEAEALHLELSHFPKKYESILMLQNPLP
jgi:hypothetical protein